MYHIFTSLVIVYIITHTHHCIANVCTYFSETEGKILYKKKNAFSKTITSVRFCQKVLASIFFLFYVEKLYIVHTTATITVE